MKIFISVLIASFLALAAGCGNTPENKPETKKTPEVKVQDAQFYSGGGNRKQTIRLKKGIAAFDYSYNHADTLTISISDTNQTLIGTVINKDGKTTEGLDRIDIPYDGLYIFEVKGTGRWSIHIW